MGRPHKNLKQVVEKEFSEFANEVNSMNSDLLERRLVSLAKSLEDVNDAKDNDEELRQAREASKELSAPYREGRRALMLKSKYVVNLLKEKGSI